MQPISLILASGSPRRHELLTQLGFQVQKQPADIDETRQNGEAPEDYVARLAVEKNRVVAAQSPDMPVVSADTCVVLGDEILGKPESPEHARQMLRRLSGQTHRVLTGVCVSLGGCAALQTFERRGNCGLPIHRRTVRQSRRLRHSGHCRLLCGAFVGQFHGRDGPAGI